MLHTAAEGFLDFYQLPASCTALWAKAVITE